MRLQMQQIINFTNFYEITKQEKLSIKTAYKLAQLASSIETNIAFYREKLQAIINQYGELDENGRPVPTEDGQGIKLRPGTDMDCNKAMYELQTFEVELPDITFTIEEFEGMNLSVAEIAPLMPFIKMD